MEGEVREGLTTAGVGSRDLAVVSLKGGREGCGNGSAVITVTLQRCHTLCIGGEQWWLAKRDARSGCSKESSQNVSAARGQGTLQRNAKARQNLGPASHRGSWSGSSSSRSRSGISSSRSRSSGSGRSPFQCSIRSSPSRRSQRRSGSTRRRRRRHPVRIELRSYRLTSTTVCESTFSRCSPEKRESR